MELFKCKTLLWVIKKKLFKKTHFSSLHKYIILLLDI